eukprot:scaffold1525_cov142-Cylindrotheca_fusiformis.AAC.199
MADGGGGCPIRIPIGSTQGSNGSKHVSRSFRTRYTMTPRPTKKSDLERKRKAIYKKDMLTSIRFDSLASKQALWFSQLS